MDLRRSPGTKKIASSWTCRFPDHVLARQNVPLDDYVEAANFLSGNPALHAPSGRLQISGLVSFRYLQMLDRALALARTNPDFNHKGPNTHSGKGGPDDV
jgi:hypothetical protein